MLVDYRHIGLVKFRLWVMGTEAVPFRFLGNFGDNLYYSNIQNYCHLIFEYSNRLYWLILHDNLLENINIKIYTTVASMDRCVAYLQAHNLYIPSLGVVKNTMSISSSNTKSVCIQKAINAIVGQRTLMKFIIHKPCELFYKV